MHERSTWIATVGFAMALVWSRQGAAQLAPTGAHYAGRSSDTGHTGPNERGGYAASIPLDLPPARGGLPVPLQIVSGGRGFGAAGVGWDVPLSFVHVDSSFGHRRPSMLPGSGITPRARISVSLLGRNIEMIQQGTGWIGRAAPDVNMRAGDGGTWTVVDGNGLVYTFTQDPLLMGTGGPFVGSGGLWLLQSIRGRGGASVVLSYQIAQTFVGDTQSPELISPAATIDLKHVSYNPDPSGTCFKDDIALTYDGDVIGAPPQSLVVIGERVIARFHKLGVVDVTSRASCATAPVRVRRYTTTYGTDPDTQQQRLTSVQVFGREGTPEASVSLPVASYHYASATTFSGGASVLRYAATATPIPLPQGATNVIAETAKVVGAIFQSPAGGSSYGALQAFEDFTGDGRPDFVFASNGKLSIATGRSGLVMAAPTLLNDSTLTRPILEARSSSADRFADEANHSLHYDFVWTQSIDVNGDGRIDIIDAAETPNTWVVYLNTPDPGPSGIKWVRRAYDVTKLRQELTTRNLNPPANYLPLSQRVTGRDFGVGICWQEDHPGHYLAIPWDNAKCGSQPTVTYEGNEQTYVEYEVKDINGDGYPDVVFNSSPVNYVSDGPPPVTQTYLGSQVILRMRPVDPSNQVEMMLNVGGVFISSTATNPFSAPESLIPLSSTCGVEKWIGDDIDGDRIQTAACALGDVNGDGIPDRIENGTFRLGTGFSFNTVKLHVPAAANRKFLMLQQSAYKDTCNVLGGAWFVASQLVGLRDLTGDGIPDLVEPKPNGLGFQVFVGTGAGFNETATDIVGPFAFSHADELCDGSTSNTVQGLYDVNGDGMPDFVQINGGSINVYQLTGGNPTGNLDAGRIVQIDNGYGATTSISYKSAKEDASTPHQVPFPEVVATSIQTTGTLGFGGTLAASSYAYGNIDMFYDSTLDAFRTTGYRRRVAVTAVPGLLTGSTSRSAQIVDAYPLQPITPLTFQFLTEAQRLGRYLQAGRVSDVTMLVGAVDVDPSVLLSVDVTTDSRRVAGQHYTVETTDTHYFADATPPADDTCKEVMFPYDWDLSSANNFGTYNACSVRGFIYTRSTQSWRGTAAPPATTNVQVYTSVRSIDDYGRATSVFYQNDASRTDDDYCVDTTYATPTDPNTHVLSAVNSRKAWACGPKDDGHVLAEESWQYDKLFAGLVFQGLPTSHTVYRHATDNGQYLATIREFDADYDATGNPITVTSTRDDGATRATTIKYDAFGLEPVDTLVSGTNVPTLEASQSFDPVTNQMLSQTDANGTVRGTTFDGFGRPLLETIQPPGAANGVLAARSYLGFGGNDPLGRRVSTKAFTDPVATSDVQTALGRVTTTYFDELGRSRFGQAMLGDDYAGETLVVGSRIYDSVGRVQFEADPYPASQVASTAYGTTRYFNPDGSPAAEIRGNGLQPFTTTPDASTERFPTVYSHTFANHAETSSIQASDALTSGSLQFGVTRQVTASAVGRALERSTWQNGLRLEYETLDHDLLGQQRALTRYQVPTTGANPVTSSWRVDSLGQLLHLDEPTSAPQDRTYDAWGELTNTTWTPTLPESTHSIITSYDAFGRLTASQEQNNGVTDNATVDKYTYDVLGASAHLTPTYMLGRLATASSPTTSIAFSYDGSGHVNGRIFTDLDNTVYVDRQAFHGDGSQQSIELDLPDNAYQVERLDYAYDSAGRLRWMWFSDGMNTQELYNASQVDAWGRVLNADLANTNYSASYANLGRRLPLHVKATSTSGTRDIVFNGFDALGRETSRDETVPTVGGHTSVSYDALGRLRTTLRTVGTTINSQWSFKYDPLGNVTSLGDFVGPNSAALSYLTTDRDRICAVAYTGSPGTCNVVHDSFGNIVKEPTRTGSNKLAYFNSGDVHTITDQSGVKATFAYDPFGAVQDLNIVSGSTQLRRDQHFGDFITQRTSKVAGTYISRQFPGPGLAISRRGPNGTWIFQFSESRGTRFTVDEKGKFVQDVSYTPFGVATSAGASPGTTTYTTDQWNEGDALENFGLVQLGKRLYDPAIGRFLSRDPLLIPRTASTTNPYAFAMNEPWNLSDPSGMDPCSGGNWCGGISSSPSSPDSGASGTAGALVATGIWAAHYFLSLTDNESPTSAMKIATAFSAAFELHMIAGQLVHERSLIEDEAEFEQGFNEGLAEGSIKIAKSVAIKAVKGPLNFITDPRDISDVPAALMQTGHSIVQTIASGDARSIGQVTGNFSAPVALGIITGGAGGADAVAEGAAEVGASQGPSVVWRIIRADTPEGDLLSNFEKQLKPRGPEIETPGIHKSISTHDTLAGARAYVERFGSTWAANGSPVRGIARIQVGPALQVEKTLGPGHWSVTGYVGDILKSWTVSVLP